MQARRGFTLIELMVVIAIIGILSTIIIAALGSARAKGRDAERIANIKVIQEALQLYYNDNNYYPINIYAAACNTGPTCGLAPTYIAAVPVDPSYGNVTPAICASAPKTAGCYKYAPLPVTGSGTAVNCTNNPPVSYHLGAALEITSATPPGVNSYSASTGCKATVVEFSGMSANCKDSSDAEQGNYNCYDQKP